MADKIVKRNGVMRKVVNTGTQQIQMKKTTKLCVEGTGNNKKLVLLRDGVKDCIPFSERPTGGTGFTCGDVANCPVIVQIQTDINTIEGDITNINTAITNLQAATTIEAMQDAVAPLLVHGNHSGLTATYDDVNNQIILTVTGGGGSFTCADVATCIDSNTTTQTALLNWLEGLTNVTLTGNRDFSGANITGLVQSVSGNLVNNTDPENPVVDSTQIGSYDNTTSGLTADNLQDAIDEVESRIETLETTGFVESVTGNIVDNTDPINPVVNQVQADWQESNTSDPSFIQNKVVRPDQLGGTTTNSKIVVRDTDGTFRDATAADITALGFSTGTLSAAYDYDNGDITARVSNQINVGPQQAGTTGNTFVMLFGYQVTILKNGVYGCTSVNINNASNTGVTEIRKNGIVIATFNTLATQTVSLGTLLTTDDIEIRYQQSNNQSDRGHTFLTKLDFRGPIT